MRFHILVNPYVPTSRGGQYNCDAFNVYACRLAKMLAKRYPVFVYGTSSNPFDKADRVNYTQIISEDEYKDLDINRGVYLTHQDNLEIKQKKNNLVVKYNTISKFCVEKNCDKGDFVLYCYMENPELQQNKNLIHVAPCSMGGGYQYAMYTIFASSVWAHYMIGKSCTQGMYSSVYCHLDTWGIAPPIFPKREFTFSTQKEPNTVLYLGRIQRAKGVETVIRLAKLMPNKLFLIAGDTVPTFDNHIFIQDTQTNVEITSNVKVIGYQDTENRRKLLSSVSCLIQPSPYAEPFGFNVVEAYLSGTPAVTTDYGTFTETVIQGVTGYRCRTDEEFVQALNNVDVINPQRCYQEGMKYTPNKQVDKYERLFKMFFNHWIGSRPYVEVKSLQIPS